MFFNTQNEKGGCRQTPKFGVLCTVFLFYTNCINYFRSDSNDEKAIC